MKRSSKNNPTHHTQKIAPRTIMNKNRTTTNSRKRKLQRGSASNGDSQPVAGGELHQIAGGGHPALTTNQGVALSDNQNSLRANPSGPTLLEDFILREKITLSLIHI